MRTPGTMTGGNRQFSPSACFGSLGFGRPLGSFEPSTTLSVSGRVVDFLPLGSIAKVRDYGFARNPTAAIVNAREGAWHQLCETQRYP